MGSFQEISFGEGRLLTSGVRSLPVLMLAISIHHPAPFVSFFVFMSSGGLKPRIRPSANCDFRMVPATHCDLLMQPVPKQIYHPYYEDNRFWFVKRDLKSILQKDFPIIWQILIK